MSVPTNTKVFTGPSVHRTATHPASPAQPASWDQANENTEIRGSVEPGAPSSFEAIVAQLAGRQFSDLVPLDNTMAGSVPAPPEGAPVAQLTTTPDTNTPYSLPRQGRIPAPPNPHSPGTHTDRLEKSGPVPATRKGELDLLRPASPQPDLSVPPAPAIKPPSRMTLKLSLGTVEPAQAGDAGTGKKATDAAVPPLPTRLQAPDTALQLHIRMPEKNQGQPESAPQPAHPADSPAQLKDSVRDEAQPVPSVRVRTEDKSGASAGQSQAKGNDSPPEEAPVQPVHLSTPVSPRPHAPQEVPATTPVEKPAGTPATAPEPPAPRYAAAAQNTNVAPAHLPAATTAAGHPPEAVVETAPHAPVIPEPKDPVAAPLRTVSLEFTADGQSDVRLRLSERAGEVHISVHSNDPSMHGRLQSGIHDLVGTLSSAGYDATAWTPGQSRENHQRQQEATPNPRRKDTPGAGAEDFEGMIQTQEGV